MVLTENFKLVSRKTLTATQYLTSKVRAHNKTSEWQA